MNGTYKARIINISGQTVTYEYSDKNGFVQISSLKPTNISIKVGDTVWITIEDGSVKSVTKRRSLFSTPFGVKLIGALVLIVVLLVLWLVFFFLKKLIIAFVWVILIAIVGIFLFSRFKH